MRRGPSEDSPKKCLWTDSESERSGVLRELWKKSELRKDFSVFMLGGTRQSQGHQKPGERLFKARAGVKGGRTRPHSEAGGAVPRGGQGHYLLALQFLHPIMTWGERTHSNPVTRGHPSGTQENRAFQKSVHGLQLEKTGRITSIKMFLPEQTEGNVGVAEHIFFSWGKEPASFGHNLVLTNWTNMTYFKNI